MFGCVAELGFIVVLVHHEDKPLFSLVAFIAPVVGLDCVRLGDDDGDLLFALMVVDNIFGVEVGVRLLDFAVM